jgi:hypothetical protein
LQWGFDGYRFWCWRMVILSIRKGFL